jgi:hypothetical protein
VRNVTRWKGLGYEIHQCVLEFFKIHVHLPSFLTHRALSSQALSLTRRCRYRP